MYKLANLILDQYDDPGLTLLKSALGVNSLEKTASYVPPLSEVEKHDINDFAIGFMDEKGAVVGRFPIYDADTASLSAFYFENTYEKLPKDFIKSAALRLGWALKKYASNVYKNTKVIKSFFNKYAKETPLETPIVDLTKEDLEPFKKTASVLNTDQRNALPDSEFGLVIKKKDGTKIRKYPLNDEAHVRNAIVRFSQFSNKIPPQYRSQLARKIKQKASQYGIEISEDNPLRKYASDLNRISPSFERNLMDRKDFVEPERWKAYESVIQDVYNRNLVHPEDVVVKIASLDQQFGLDPFYAKEMIKDPETVVYGMYEGQFDPIERAYYENRDAIMKKKAALNNLMGDEFVERLTLDKFKSLDDNTRSMILKIAKKR